MDESTSEVKQQQAKKHDEVGPPWRCCGGMTCSPHRYLKDMVILNNCCKECLALIGDSLSVQFLERFIGERTLLHLAVLYGNARAAASKRL